MLKKGLTLWVMIKEKEKYQYLKVKVKTVTSLIWGKDDGKIITKFAALKTKAHAYKVQKDYHKIKNSGIKIDKGVI